MNPERKAPAELAGRSEIRLGTLVNEDEPSPRPAADGTGPAGRRTRRGEHEPGGPRPGALKRTIATGVIAVVAVVFLIPFYWLLLSALRRPDRIFADAGDFLPSGPTLQNFETLFNDTPIFTWFTNSVILAGGSAIGSMVVVTMAAYALARIRFPFRNTIFVSILASQMLPFHLLLIPLFLLMINLSLIDTYLGVIVPMLAHPFGLFYMRQYMLGLPQDVLDAARADGASEYRIFAQVVVPMVKPALATLAIIFSLEQWNDLLWPLIVMRSESKYPLAVGIATLDGLYRPRWDLVMTASVVAVLPIMVLFFLLRKKFIGGLGQLGTGGR